MTSTLITNIGQLVTNDQAQGDGTSLGVLYEAAVVIEGERVAWVGPASAAPPTDLAFDAERRSVTPGFVDSHTHLVFDGERSGEFVARMAGERYTSGGIMTTVAATRAAPTEQLRAGAARRVAEMVALGTTSVEIKSGYGLNVADEVRLLEIGREFTPETTFLGAHAVPAEYVDDRETYLDLVTGEMLAACAPLSRWVDVFCDTGAFSADEARRVLAAGVEAGLMPRLHGNQIERGPGVQIAVEYHAASVDHCTYLSGDDVAALAESDVVATLLPAADFSTRSPYPDARRLLDAGVTVALATDCNPGTAYVTSMPFCIALAVREMRMTPDEALAAATKGGALALRRDDVGRIAPGARADLVLLDAPNYVHLAYRPGASLVRAVWTAGRLAWSAGG